MSAGTDVDGEDMLLFAGMLTGEVVKLVLVLFEGSSTPAGAAELRTSRVESWVPVELSESLLENDCLLSPLRDCVVSRSGALWFWSG